MFVIYLFSDFNIIDKCIRLISYESFLVGRVFCYVFKFSVLFEILNFRIIIEIIGEKFIDI